MNNINTVYQDIKYSNKTIKNVPYIEFVDRVDGLYLSGRNSLKLAILHDTYMDDKGLTVMDFNEITLEELEKHVKARG